MTPPFAASGVRWIAAGILPDAPRHAAVGDERDLEAAVLQHAEYGRELVQFGHAVRARPLEAHDRDEIAIEFAALERVLDVVLLVEDERRRLDDLAIGGHRRNLDDGAAEVAAERPQAAVGAKRVRHGTQYGPSS